MLNYIYLFFAILLEVTGVDKVCLKRTMLAIAMVKTPSPDQVAYTIGKGILRIAKVSR